MIFLIMMRMIIISLCKIIKFIMMIRILFTLDKITFIIKITTHYQIINSIFKGKKILILKNKLFFRLNISILSNSYMNSDEFILIHTLYECKMFSWFHYIKKHVFAKLKCMISCEFLCIHVYIYIYFIFIINIYNLF